MTDCPTTPFGTTECALYIKDTMREIAAGAGQNCEIVISTAAPIVVGPYGVNGYECPHGVTYWIEPTGEQIAGWNVEGLP